MTRLDAEELEFSTYVDYNKPKFSNLLERDLDNTKVRADEWYLKPQYQQTGVHTYDRASGHFNNDISYNNRSVIVVGTELQIYNKFCEMLKTYGWQLQDSWDRELKPEYLKHYKSNNNSPIIINLI
jgi:hypothetical protein